MSTQSPNAQHAGAYRRLFTHALLIEQLIRHFVSEEIADALDFDQMEQVDSIFYTESLARRENDIMWKIALRDGRALHLILLVEFQSRNDHAMAARILNYAGLFYQHMTSLEGWSWRDGLPPLLPVVIYNGLTTWTAEEEFAELIHLDVDSPLWDYQPRLRYYLIDEGRLSPRKLRQGEDLVSLFFQMEQATTLDEFQPLVDRLIERAKGDALEKIRQDFIIWFDRVLYRTTGITIDPEDVDSLMEVRDMLEENLRIWKEKTEREHQRRGMERGLAEGLEQGREQGQTIAFRHAVRLLLRKRFGEDPEREARVDALELAHQEVAMLAILDAEDEASFWRMLEVREQS